VEDLAKDSDLIEDANSILEEFPAKENEKNQGDSDQE